MKHLRKIVSILLTAIMVLAMCIPVMADGVTGGNGYTITAPDNGHTYDIYQIFTGEVSGGNLIKEKWGENAKNVNSTVKKGDTVPSGVLQALEAVSQEITHTDSEQLNVITKYVDFNSSAIATITGGPSTGALPVGYYLIKDVASTNTNNNDAFSIYMVKLLNSNITIQPKVSVPTAEKKVKDVNDSTGITTVDNQNSNTEWIDSADYDIGDDVPFQLKGTVAADYDRYTKYKFVFHDKQQKDQNGASVFNFKPDTVKVTVDGQEVKNTETNKYYNVKTTGLSDGDDFEIEFSNLKQISSVHAGSVIIVEYNATLNSNAVIGKGGNKNTMHLEYSNNPEQEGSTGHTPDDTVIVFTYQTTINKVDKDKNPLEGAEFTLEKFYKNESNGEWRSITKVNNGSSTVFEFAGLDDGYYRLTETTHPEGYNPIDPIYFTTTAEHELLSDNPGLISLRATETTEQHTNKEAGSITFTSTNEDDGILTTNVVNKKGSLLPETGGIGTTIFYIVGVVLVLGAGVLLVTKKRMNADK